MRTPTLFAALLCFYVIASAEPLIKDTTTVRLFNGRDFEGLHIYTELAKTDPATEWKVEDGVLRCVSTNKGYICTKTAYADYHLRLEWRWPDKPGNSGVLVNVVDRDVIWPKCIECQLAAGRAGDFAFYSDARSKEEIVSRNPSGVSTGRLPRKATSPVEKPVGEWNIYDIIVAGDTITVSINGVQVNRTTNVQPSAGMIAFQAEGSTIEFRNIELTPLPAAKELNAPMPAH
jgi:hypothetical protein